MSNKFFNNFKPTYFENTVYDIDFDKYYNLGFRAIIFDIDNTLVLHDVDIDDNCKKLFDKLNKIGFHIAILSNNNLNRVKKFLRDYDYKYIYDANKPNKKSYLEIIKLLNIDKDKTLYIGDQLFTDIFGANNAKLKSILVKPLGKEIYLHIKLKRLFEKLIFVFIMEDKNG